MGGAAEDEHAAFFGGDSGIGRLDRFCGSTISSVYSAGAVMAGLVSVSGLRVPTGGVTPALCPAPVILPGGRCLRRRFRVLHMPFTG